MGKVLIDESTLTDIGNAIRTKKGTSGLIQTTNMKNEILSIQGGGGSGGIDGGYTVNFYNNNELIGSTNAKSGVLVEKPLISILGAWDNADGEEVAFPISYDANTVEDLYFRDYAFVNSIYEYFGVDANVYTGFYINSWYSSRTNWRIKAMFYKSMSHSPYTLYDLLKTDSGSGYIDVDITSDEYENANYYSNAELIFEALKAKNAIFASRDYYYNPDNDVNSCYFTIYDTDKHTNLVDLREI